MKRQKIQAFDAFRSDWLMNKKKIIRERQDLEKSFYFVK